MSSLDERAVRLWLNMTPAEQELCEERGMKPELPMQRLGQKRVRKIKEEMAKK